MDILRKSYQYANRKEIEFELIVKEGVLPSELCGVVYLTSMCGNVNSGGLPIPEKHEGDPNHNPEFGTPQLASDGMMFKIDFNTPGKVCIKTFISKPPCYYADLATDRENSPSIEKEFQDYGFKSAGLTRASMQLGFRNTLNVAVIPFQFSNDAHPRMLVTFDAGRPWEFNTKKLELITPIDKYDAWIKGTPPGLKFPFSIIQTTAHPSFDPIKKELFTVNYTQEKSIGYQLAFFMLLLEHRDEVKEHLEEKANLFDKIKDSIKNSKGIKEITEDLKSFFEKPEEVGKFKNLLQAIFQKHKITSEDLNDFFKKPEKKGKFVTFLKSIFKKNNNVSEELKNKASHALSSPNEVYLMKWNGKQEPLKKWKVTDENGQDIIIDECMHQTALTEDYILLSDSSFKFSSDLLINNPFPEVPAVDNMLRLLLNKKTPLEMNLYIVSRADLKDSTDTVTAKKVSLPKDCIHFSANYKNPSGNITLYTINNNSVCVSEWIRPYDTLKFTGQPVPKELVGLPAMAGMDLNSLSKYTIQASTGNFTRLDCVEKGGTEPGKVDKAHTWELCLLTYRDMIAPDKAVDEIKNLFVYSAGLNSQRLTTFMYNLFKNDPDKIVPTDEVMKYTEAGVQQSLFRLSTDEMKIVDYYMTDFNAEIHSLQFVPRRHEREGVDYTVNGYVLCTMMVGESKVPNAPITMNYERELWIFEADNLSKGPVCKLSHPELSYAFTLHSAWIKEAEEQESNYHISIREDFSNPESFLPGVQKNIKPFFEKYILPNFDRKKI